MILESIARLDPNPPAEWIDAGPQPLREPGVDDRDVSRRVPIVRDELTSADKTIFIASKYPGEMVR